MTIDYSNFVSNLNRMTRTNKVVIVFDDEDETVEYDIITGFNNSVLKVRLPCSNDEWRFFLNRIKGDVDGEKDHFESDLFEI